MPSLQHILNDASDALGVAIRERETHMASYEAKTWGQNTGKAQQWTKIKRTRTVRLLNYPFPMKCKTQSEP
jgi:hypothetical protein